jgi:hypothetical protein
MVDLDAPVASRTGASKNLHSHAMFSLAHRIVRAFLIEEAKIVKRVIKQQKEGAKK